MHNLPVYIPYFESDLQELPFTLWTNACCFCYNLKYRHNTTSTVYTIFANSRNSRIFTLRYPDFFAAIKLTDKSGYPDNGYPDMQTLVVSAGYPALLSSSYFERINNDDDENKNTQDKEVALKTTPISATGA